MQLNLALLLVEVIANLFTSMHCDNSLNFCSTIKWLDCLNDHAPWDKSSVSKTENLKCRYCCLNSENTTQVHLQRNFVCSLEEELILLNVPTITHYQRLLHVLHLPFACWWTLTANIFSPQWGMSILTKSSISSQWELKKRKHSILKWLFNWIFCDFLCLIIIEQS